MSHLTLVDRLRLHAAGTPDAPALLAPGRPTLNYAGLWALVQQTVARYNALGVGRGDHLVLALPNGPELAAALVSAMAGAIAVPLNPASALAEFEQYLSSLPARAVVVPAGSASPATAAARALGVPVLELAHASDAPAGLFELRGPAAAAARPGLAQPDDLALTSFTSGTTGRPKRVPMPLHTLSTAAALYARSLDLTDADRCLNIMPFFHGHGIMAVLLGSLVTGASVFCAPNFAPAHFFDWLNEAEPTWYSAIPTLHQAVLARAAETPERVAAMRPLRFIRSASAPLAPAVRDELRRVFGVPVYQGYGITEANLVASTAPHRDRPGSVGQPAGYQIEAMAPDTGALLPRGQVGELVLRGPSLFPGYAGDPEATARAFAHGWFHTGDQGYVDADDFVFITGRLKELISRGAEQVAPAEVEAALLAHPSVAEAVAFAIPHPRLGEVVGAAVVARAGQRVDVGHLRRFVAERLSFYKVPEQVAVLPALPRNAVGKVARLGLASQLGLSAEAAAPGPAPYEPPATPLEQDLAAVWQAVLGRARVGRHDRFLALGGDSLLAGQLVARVAEVTGLNLSLLDFFDAPTVAQQAELVASLLALDSVPALAETHEYGSL